MGILEILTIVFVVLKLIGVISWSWWLVLLPTIISVSCYIIWAIVVVTIAGRTHRKVKKSFERDFWK